MNNAAVQYAADNGFYQLDDFYVCHYCGAVCLELLKHRSRCTEFDL
jgi:hypothetical protein